MKEPSQKCESRQLSGAGSQAGEEQQGRIDQAGEARKIDISVQLPYQDRLRLSLVIRDGWIVSSSLTGSGCLEFLELMEEWRGRLSGRLEELSLPSGVDHSSLLMREALLKARGEWQFPFVGDELCHCRAVPTAKVDSAILAGSRTISSVARQTSAGTSCGTCRPDIESIISFRLGHMTSK